MKSVLFFIALFAAAAPAQELHSTAFTVEDALAILDAHGWSFVYVAGAPVRQVDVLVFEEHTDKEGRTTTAVRRGGSCTAGEPAIRFEIRMLLTGQTLHSRINDAARTTTLGEEFAPGTHESRFAEPREPGADGKQFLLEIANIDRGAMLPPNKTVLMFKVFEDLDPVILERMLKEPGKN